MILLACISLTILCCYYIHRYTISILNSQHSSQYETPTGIIFNAHPDDSSANAQFIQYKKSTTEKIQKSLSIKKGLHIIRDFAHSFSDGFKADSQFIPVEFPKFNAEWVISKFSDPNKRILYIHGGAFIAGSAMGHRKLTDQLAKIANASVLSINYRLMPEHSRLAGIEDAQTAYQWILSHAPDIKNQTSIPSTSLHQCLVAGDSAGGGLCFMLSSWSEQKKIRRPDAVIGFSPSLDSALTANSYKQNRKTDYILGSGLGILTQIPKTIAFYLTWFFLKTKPTNPLISPLFYSLNNLPPTLIQASSSEMLLGDAIQYTNKARQSGSHVTLQIWEEQIHGWQLFNMGIGSANHSWKEVEKFIQNITID